MAQNKILILTVLYKQTFEESSTIRCLKAHSQDFKFPHKILIYNNYPEQRVEADGTFDCEVVNAEKNEFLAGPYNFAWRKAVAEGYDWLLLFDQDSAPSLAFFSELNEKLSIADERTAAIVPLIDSDGVRVSPLVLTKSVGPFCRKPNTTIESKLGANEYLSAINSCSCMSVRAVTAINGFSEEFPLDYLDSWIFWEFSNKGYSVIPMSAVVQHSLSIAKSFCYMGVTRYTAYMEAKKRFAKMVSWKATFLFKFVSLGVAVKLVGRPSEWKFIIPTLKAIL